MSTNLETFEQSFYKIDTIHYEQYLNEVRAQDKPFEELVVFGDVVDYWNRRLEMHKKLTSEFEQEGHEQAAGHYRTEVNYLSSLVESMTSGDGQFAYEKFVEIRDSHANFVRKMDTVWVKARTIFDRKFRKSEFGPKNVKASKKNIFLYDKFAQIVAREKGFEHISLKL